ncbi:preprotein translocase subunit SecF, partial [mine drainage metagenome]
MEFFRMKRDIPFMSWGKYTTTVSLITFLLAVFFLYSKGLNFSVDFTGGTVMEVHTAGQADLTGMRLSLKQLGLHDANVQNFGSSHDVLIRLPLRHGVSSGALSEKVRQALRQQDASLQVRRVEFVGPQVGDELVKDGSAALLFVSLGIVIYLSLRFKWRPAVATLMANLHDVVIILGFFAFFQWEFSLSVLAAVLAILGYSVNESVVVFDRVRENFRKMRGASVSQVIDNAITRTMSRTIITHGCTQLMVTSMLFFGGEALHYFALALT